MAYEFKLPDIGEGVVEGEIVRWLVKEGDTLAMDQPMVEVMTDKATVEIPAPRAGQVLKRHFGEGQVCPVGAVLIAIEPTSAGTTSGGGHDHAAPESRRKRTRTRPGAAESAEPEAENAVSGGNGAAGTTVFQSTGPAPANDEAPSREILATPATRKLARELGVNLSQVNASGPAGRITHEDVRAAAGRGTRTQAAPRTEAQQGDVRLPFKGMRRKIAERMTLAKQKAAHFTYVEEVDATALVNLRNKANARLTAQGLKLSYLPFIIKATVEALKTFPQLNATLDEAAGEIVQRRQYHIGIASATADGLVVPVVKDADRRSLTDLARELERLAAATKSGRATREDLVGSTFTITSLGTLGGLLATPIINYPEVAILGIHKIAPRPVAIEDKIEIRQMMNLSISVDHRLVDGHEAASFVARIKDSLETPGLLFLDAI